MYIDSSLYSLRERWMLFVTQKPPSLFKVQSNIYLSSGITIQIGQEATGFNIGLGAKGYTGTQ